MSTLSVRPFRRTDREQLTDLVNAHIGAVVPGWAVSVNAVMAQLEREPGESVVDPWVAERTALVAVERDAVVAGALLKRYRDDPDVGPDYADMGEVTWCLFWPGRDDAADRLLAACHDTFERWSVSGRHACGSLPTPAAYGVPDCWPHVAAALRSAGFVAGADHGVADTVEVIMVADVADLPARRDPPVEGLSLRREVGYQATRFAVALDGRDVAALHVRTDLTNGGALSRLAGWGDVWELWVCERLRRQGVATWLLAEGAAWLRLGRVDRLIDQAWPSEADRLGFMAATGWRELTRTEKWWVWRPS